ncbi:MAG: aminoglycoside phosphotransferase family protein [Geobacteraceae bacterium]|nr:aminoglycoside phosphotransferase family protein [Geobacteraceae bacterium]
MSRISNKDTILVNNHKHLTRHWAQAVLHLHDDKATVRAVDVVSVHVGTTTRVQLAVDHDSHHVARRWFVKLPSRNWKARLFTALPRLLQTEVRFYQQMAKHIPLNIPTCLAARSKWGRGAILVLDDITEQGGRAGTAGDTLDIQQAYTTVEQLARFHAGFWCDTTLPHRYPWVAGSVRQLEDLFGSALAVPLMRCGLRKAGSLIPDELHEPALNYARNRKKVMAFLNDAPQTVTHHDCHPGNLFWREDGSVGFLDWQLVRLGEGIGDLAYLLTTTLTPEVRRRHEADLLAYYAETVCSQGITGLSDDIMTRYRVHCCYTFEAMVITLAIGGMMELTSNFELIRRTSIAVKDLNCFAALPLAPR